MTDIRTNPVGTKEQREELRQEWDWTIESKIAALDGLDIAEEAMRAEHVLRVLCDLEELGHPGWGHWYTVAINAIKEACAKWDKWKGDK